jgi:uncharacterized Ntn-hydrolase superfamily protein
MTYSILARDPETGQFGVGSQSHFFGVGRLVGWLSPGIGGVATQSFVNVDFGPMGLDALGRGHSAQETLDYLIDGDELREYRQLGVIDEDGNSATFTGNMCVPSAGGNAGTDVVVQGNMLASDEVYKSMVTAFESSVGDLPTRILAAMRAAEGAGGDARGSQSAMLKIVSGLRSDTPWREVQFDLRVDDHADPIGELSRLLPLHRAFDAVGGLMFAPRLMMGPYENVSEQELTATLESLDAAIAVLGDNLEGAFWKATLLARAGRTADAEALYGQVFEAGPHLRPYRDAIATVGFLDNTGIVTR